MKNPSPVYAIATPKICVVRVEEGRDKGLEGRKEGGKAKDVDEGKGGAEEDEEAKKWKTRSNGAGRIVLLIIILMFFIFFLVCFVQSYTEVRKLLTANR
jgi:hypothetical protein